VLAAPLNYIGANPRSSGPQPSRQPSRQAQALADLARTAARAGDLDWAEAAARAIADPSRQAKSFGHSHES